MKGTLVGCDSRTPDGYQEEVSLRETKLYWCVGGHRYRKTDGVQTGSPWPMKRLELDSIREEV